MLLRGGRAVDRSNQKNLDMIFKKLITHEDLPANVGEWSSTHIMGDSLMKAQESVQVYCVKEQMMEKGQKEFKNGV